MAEKSNRKIKANSRINNATCFRCKGKIPGIKLSRFVRSQHHPLELVKAHRALDKVVDFCYRSQPFINETKRIELLFELYYKIVSGIFWGEEREGKNQCNLL